MKVKCLYILCVLLAVSCSKREAKDHVDALPEIFPDYIGVTVPENICPMNFSVPGADYIRAIIKNEKGEEIDVTGKDHVEIPERAWHELINSKFIIQKIIIRFLL